MRNPKESLKQGKVKLDIKKTILELPFECAQDARVTAHAATHKYLPTHALILNLLSEYNRSKHLGSNWKIIEPDEITAFISALPIGRVHQKMRLSKPFCQRVKGGKIEMLFIDPREKVFFVREDEDTKFNLVPTEEKDLERVLVQIINQNGEFV